MSERKRTPRTGYRESPSPKEEERAKGGPPAQEQRWPGHEEELRPHPDHGEESYEGAGRLEGSAALITGGDSGIGRAVAIAFAREGADVAIAYFNEHDDAAETARWVEDAGRRAVTLPGDLADPGHCAEVVRRTVDAFGEIGILVNNAAVHWEKRTIEDIRPEQLDRVFRTNIFSFFWVTQAALEHMDEGGAIINTGSVTGLRGSRSLIDYSATKGAIHVFTMSLAQSLADRGIRVNCVAPGPVWTPLIAATRSRERIEGFGAETFWRRPAQPAEIAPSYVFLASTGARYYTGEILAPTGGVATR